jgi:hypothetical protein
LKRLHKLGIGIAGTQVVPLVEGRGTNRLRVRALNFDPRGAHELPLENNLGLED